MPKVLVEFNSIEEAQAAIHAVSSASIPAHIAVASAPAAPPLPPAPAPANNPPPLPPVPGAPAGNPPPPPAPVAQPPAPPAPVAAPVAAPATSAAPAPGAETGGITVAMLGAAAQAYSKKYKAAATKAVFTHYGITKVGEAPVAIYQELYAALSR